MDGRNKKGQFAKNNKYGKGSKGKYKREYAEMLIKYFGIEPSREVKKGKKTIRVANEYPMFEKFARDLGVTVRTLENWAQKHEEFARAYEMAKDSQRYILITNALFSRYNANFAKFVAAAHHGMPDGDREEDGTEDDIDVTIKIIE